MEGGGRWGSGVVGRGSWNLVLVGFGVCWVGLGEGADGDDGDDDYDDGGHDGLLWIYDGMRLDCGCVWEVRFGM